MGVSRRKWITTTTRDRGARPAPIWSNATSARPRRTGGGWPTSPTFRPGPAFYSWRRYSMRSAAPWWPMETPLRTELVLSALNLALGQHWDNRGPPRSFIIRTRVVNTLRSPSGCDSRQAAMRPSRGSVGDGFDNPRGESFFATLECELLDRRRLRTQAAARMAIFDSYRRLVQSAPPPLRARLAVADRLRTSPSRRCQPDTVGARPPRCTARRPQIQNLCSFSVPPSEQIKGGAEKLDSDHVKPSSDRLTH